jgi:hypothetical protein
MQTEKPQDSNNRLTRLATYRLAQVTKRLNKLKSIGSGKAAKGIKAVTKRALLNAQ